MNDDKIKNSLRNGPDELGYYGHGESAMGGMPVGETLIPVLHELKGAFEDAIKDKNFLDEYAYYCKHYIGRPSPLYYAENLSKKFGAKILFKQEHLNHTGSHKANNALFQTLLAKRMKKSTILVESGAGQHYSASCALAAKFKMKIIGVMGKTDIGRVNQNILKAKHYGGKLIAVEGTLKEAITHVMKLWTSSPEYYYLCGSVCSAFPIPQIVQYAQSIIGKELRQQLLDQEGKLANELIGCIGSGSNFLGLIHEFLDEPEILKIGVEAKETAALTNGTVGIMQGMKTYMLQSKDGARSLGGSSLGAGIQYFASGPEHSFLKDNSKSVSYTYASDKEMLNAYKETSLNEGISLALEPTAAVAVALKRAKGKPKDYLIVISACGRGEKDLETIEKYIGKEFE